MSWTTSTSTATSCTYTQTHTHTRSRNSNASTWAQCEGRGAQGGNGSWKLLCVIHQLQKDSQMLLSLYTTHTHTHTHISFSLFLPLSSSLFPSGTCSASFISCFTCGKGPLNLLRKDTKQANGGSWRGVASGPRGRQREGAGAGATAQVKDTFIMCEERWTQAIYPF